MGHRVCKGGFRLVCRPEELSAQCLPLQPLCHLRNIEIAHLLRLEATSYVCFQ